MSQILQKVAPIGESRDKELLKSASSYVYASRHGAELLAHVFFPESPTGMGRSAVAFFHGGFWDTPMVSQFVPHCHHFASRGAVAVSFEYRVGSKNGTGPVEAVEDAKAALLWLHENADLLGIDAEKIAVAGAAGGAFLALQLAMQKHAKDAAIPPIPKAAILFSAVVNTTPKGQLSERFPDKKVAKALSPNRLVRRKLPPILLMHGKSDRVTPFEEVATFRRRMKWRGNRCKLLDFSGAEHSFFNFNVSHTNFEMTIAAADRFLVEQNILAELPEESH
ncbi:MAG: alpha/beta hydrolase [Akkermansiaceae bacterium]|nr:alpha/beta hydrolase [Akkermansiaceae bacterium]